MFEWLRAYLTEVATVLLSIPINLNEKFFIVYLLSFVVLAYCSYRLYYQQPHKNLANKKQQRPGFFRFLFPKSIYWHDSAKIDYGIFLINLLISPLILVGVALQTLVSIEVAEVLKAWNNDQAVFVGEWSSLTFGLFILGYTLAADLSVYLLHRFHHRSDLFWPLHALHHSATVMTPVTLFRKHPLWNLLASSFSALLTGLFQGIFVFVFYGGPGKELLFGINTVYVLYNFFGANLRHSHVWLSWGKPLSYLFISPAMHQIHHDPTRMNRNYGEVFAIWDWLFGSLTIPTHRENFKIGLAEPNPHTTLWQAYYIPIKELGAQFRKRVRKLWSNKVPS